MTTRWAAERLEVGEMVKISQFVMLLLDKEAQYS